MARQLFLGLFLSLLFVGVPAFALPTPFVLSDQSSVKLAEHVEYFLEPEGQLGLHEVLQLPEEQWLQTHRKGFMVLGLTEQIYWFRFSLVADSYKSWQFSMRYFFNGDATIYLRPKLTPSSHPDNSAPVQLIGSVDHWDQRHYSLPLPLVPGHAYDVFMRVKVPGPDKFAFVIDDPDAKKDFDIWDNRWVGVFYGGFITMLLYNLFLAVSTRSFTYGYYLLYMLSMLFYLMAMDGLLQFELSRYYIAICGIVAFGCQFCRHFLRTATTLPGPDRLIKGIIGSAIVLGILLILLGALTLLTNLVMVLVASYGLVLGAVGMLSRRRGNHVARFFLLAWVFPLAGMLYTDLMYLGWLPFTDVGYSAMNVATLIEAILLSMALADRINELRTQRQRAVVDAKQKLEMSNRALEKANRLKDSFLGTISHELRTPMNGIIGTLELLKSTRVDQHQKECLTTLENSSAQMLTMVERILLFSELQSGSVKTQAVTLDVQGWATRLVENWSSLFAEKGLAFRVQVDATSNDWVQVDIKKIDYLVGELLSNALKFTSHGEVWVDLHQRSQGGVWQWILEVGDSGIGIADEQLQNITHSFRQGQTAYNRQYGGLGIGMAICKELVAALNGDWRVESEQHKGTRIHAVIPIIPAVAPEVQPDTVTSAPVVRIQSAEAARPLETRPLRPSKTAPAALEPPAILVVEDNAVNQMVMKKILESLGWTFCIANNGVEAVEKTREKAFALILMDCQMPVMDGFAATEAIRAGDNLNQHTPIVAVTANATDQDREHCITSGMNDYLKKPVKPNDIGTIITRYVQVDVVEAVS